MVQHEYRTPPGPEPYKCPAAFILPALDGRRQCGGRAPDRVALPRGRRKRRERGSDNRHMAEETGQAHFFVSYFHEAGEVSWKFERTVVAGEVVQGVCRNRIACC